MPIATTAACPARAPQVLAVHALTGSADAAGDWWEPLIGPGRALDTTRLGVLCANLLGGRYGTTGPTSPSPETGEPYGRDFPEVSTRDQARVQWLLLDALGVGELAVVTGGSLGGMVSLEIAHGATRGRPDRRADGRTGGDRRPGHGLERDPAGNDRTPG